MTEGAPLLELRGVSKAFGAVRALDGVNFTVPAGKGELVIIASAGSIVKAAVLPL